MTRLSSDDILSLNATVPFHPNLIHKTAIISENAPGGLSNFCGRRNAPRRSQR